MRPEAAPRHEEVSQFYPMNPLLRKEVKDVCSGETLAAAAAAASAPGDGDSLLKVLTDEALDAVLLDTRGNIITIERPGEAVKPCCTRHLVQCRKTTNWN